MLQKIGFYIMSLWLLFLLIFFYTVRIPFIDEKTNWYSNIVPIICVIFMIISYIYYKIFLYKYAKGYKYLPETINNIQDINFETVSFLITYIIPLFFLVANFNVSEYHNYIVLSITLLAIGIIYCRTNLFYTNPTLSILGYRIYKISTIQHSDVIILTRNKLKKGDSIFPRLIDDNIYYATKELK